MTSIASVAALIEFHEGRKPLAYQDTRGNWTVGVGHDLEAKPLSDAAVDQIFKDDLADALAECWAIFGSAWASINAPRQAALQDMAYELGEGGLAKFVEMIAAVRVGDWPTAAAQALSSAWAAEVPERAKMDAEMLLTGGWPA